MRQHFLKGLTAQYRILVKEFAEKFVKQRPKTADKKTHTIVGINQFLNGAKIINNEKECS